MDLEELFLRPKVSGAVLILLILATTIILQLLGVIDVLANVTDIWLFAIALPLLSIGLALLIRSPKEKQTSPITEVIESSREDIGNRKLTRIEAHNLAKDDAVHYLSGTEAHSVGASYEPVREIIEDGELRYLIEGIAYDRNHRKWRFQVCVTQDRKVILNHSIVFPIN